MFLPIPMLRGRKKLPEFQPGDILGFSGNCWLSALINLATYGMPFWSLSHIGILGEYDSQLVLFESSEYPDPPCLIRGERMVGTKAVPLQGAIADYDGKVWHYPLYRRLYSFERDRLNEFLIATVGLPYDGIGAMRSGGLGWSWLESQLRPADLGAIFCSEWCCAAHTHIGLFQTDHVSRWSPNRFVRAERRQGILKAPWRLK